MTTGIKHKSTLNMTSNKHDEHIKHNKGRIVEWGRNVKIRNVRTDMSVIGYITQRANMFHQYQPI